MASRTHSTPATAGRQANPISRREWWLGVGLVFVALMAHALLPRYEYTAFGPQNADVIRVDRWISTRVHSPRGAIRRRRRRIPCSRPDSRDSVPRKSR